uniref:Retrovirus-related Pol polyprotein from transposon TNT 1-94 n=1 Tax=Nicotiana tabacum TaxID=4097 RepID=A0A1S3YQ50_TOBAC|nr:PREDICTED: uncharacterized protein LOC107778502 [Nicotiana tabacum]
MMRQNRNSRRGKTNFRNGRLNNDNDKNDGRCYECGKHGHIQAECPELKKKLNRNFQKKKSFGAWSDEEESDHEKIANMCFMAIKENSNEDSGELGLMADKRMDDEEDSCELGLMADERTSEVRLPTCPNCYELQEFVDIALADIERVLNELRKIKRENKDWALKLEVYEIERDMLQDEVNGLQLQLNRLQKSTSHSSVKSNQIVPHISLIRTRNPTTYSYCGKNGHNTNQCRNRIREERGSKIPIILLVSIAESLGTRLTVSGSRTKGDGFGDLNLSVKLILRNLSRLGYLKIVIQNGHQSRWRNSTFGDKSKGNITRVGKVPLISTCDVDKVYMVDELSYNLLGISQLYNDDYEVRFKKHGWFIEDESGKVILSGNRDRNIYTISNVDNLDNQICLASMIDDPWVWHRKLGHASMHTIQKLPKNDLLIGLPKLDFSNDQFCDACQLGKQTCSSFNIKNIVSTTKPLQLMHMDLFGPTRTASIGGRKYVFVILDDFSHFAWVIFLSHKDEALRNFEVFCKKVQCEKGYYISTIKSDYGGEFESRAFENLCNDQGISHNFSSPRSAQQNGVAKAVSTACHIINIWNSKKPNIRYFHPFRCKCFIHNNGKDNLGKLDPKSDEDTNPRPRNEKLPEYEEISIVPKSINTGKITPEQKTDQQDQSTMNLSENQESTTIDPTNSVGK